MGRKWKTEKFDLFDEVKRDRKRKKLQYERIFDYSTLADFLQDEIYWGEKSEESIGVIGDYAWDEEHAYELASEYEHACEILQYYKNIRGI